jgi:pyruvate dehydrogenase E1 component alpha subunit
LRNHLSASGAWTKAQEERLIEENNREIDAAVERYMAVPPQPPESMFDHLYAELPAAYAAQRVAAARGGDHG